MRLGLLTAPFPETPLMDVVDWTAANGFESIEIACWPRSTGPTRRYAGTSHIDVADLSASQATELVDEIRGKGLTISGLGYYPNPLHPDPAHRDEVIGHLKHVITAAEKMDVAVRQHVHGRRRREDQDANWQEALKVWPDIVAFAQDHGRQDHDRELPDAVQPRRVAGRAQPRDDAAHLAPDPRAVGRHDRAQLRSIAPDPPDDRHPAVHPRVRAAHPPRPGQGPDDRPRRALRARRLLARHRLAGPAPAGARRRRVGPAVRRCGGPATTAT